MESLVKPTFWRGRKVLVTGHTGFKGGWLLLLLQALEARVGGLALAPEHEQGIFSRSAPWDGIDSYIGDIRDTAVCTGVMRECKPEVVFHLAAQPLVRRGYAGPQATYDTNVMGTINVLEAALAAGTVKAIVAVTSDKVYANPEAGRPFREGDRLGGADPYSCSKACAELVVASYRTSYLEKRGIAIATARAGNVIGGGDCGVDRLLPDIFRTLDRGEAVRLRNPGATRPWQHVLDVLSGYLVLAEALFDNPRGAPQAVNFGPRDETPVTVSDVAERAIEICGGGRWEPEADAEFAEAACLGLDSTLARDRLGFRGQLDLQTALSWTAEWHKAEAAGAEMRPFGLRQIQSYRELSS